MKTDTAYRYRLYEIPVISEIELPELEPRERDLTTFHDQVEITIGTVPGFLEKSIRTEDGWYEFTSAQMICSVPSIGRFHVSAGRSIVIQPDPAATKNDIRAYLFGVAFAAVIHQRHLLPLHISAVRTPYGVWAFTGDSGAGKSTLVGLLNQLTGWPILCDDVAVVRIINGTPLISAGLRRLKLWDDAVEMLGVEKNNLVRDLERENKFHLNAPKMFNTQTMPLRALVRLERGEKPELSELSGARLFETVMNAIYRPYLVPVFGDRLETANMCAKVAETIGGYVFRRPWSTVNQAQAAQFLIKQISK